MRFIVFFFFCFITSVASAQIQWEEKLGGPFGGDIYDIEVYTGSSPAKIFLISNSSAYKSEDNGSSWTKINHNANFTDFEVVGTTVYLLANNKLFHSPDGNTFTQLSSGSSFNNAQRIKKVPGGGFVLTDFNSIFYSANGVTWTQGYAPGSGLYNRHLEVNDDGQIFIIKDLGPYRSSDGGVSFTLQATGIAEPVHSLGAATDGSLVYAVSTAKIYSSTDGAAWANIKGAVISDATIVNVSIHEKSFLEFSADGTTMFFFDNQNKKLYRKAVSDPPTNWTLRASTFPSTTLVTACAAASTNSALAFGTEGGVYISSSGGSSYSESNTGITEVNPGDPKGLYVDPFGNMFIPGGYSGLLKGTLGTSWTRVANVPPPVFLFSVSAEGDELFAISSGTIYRSTDKGLVWQALTLPASSTARWVGAADNDRVFAMTSNHDPANFYYSKNKGTNWTASVVNITGLPADYYIFENEVFVASSNLLFLQLENFSNSQTEFYRINITYNGTNDITTAVATKITTQPLVNIERFLAQDGSIYVYSRFTDQLAISTNGTSWTTLSTPAGDGDFFKADNGYLFLADYQQDKIHISRDEGLTWQSTNWTPAADLFDTNSIEVSGGIGVVVFNGANYHRSTNTIVTPIAPSGLTAVGIEANSIALRWQDNSNNEDKFVVERSTNGVDFIEVGTITFPNSSCFGNTYFTDNQVEGDIDYVYRVLASNAAGAVSSGTLPVQTLPGCTYTIPNNRSWTQGAVTDINIKDMGNGTYQINDLLGDGTDKQASFKESCSQTYLVTDDNNDYQANGNGSWNGTTTLTLLLRECGTNGTTTETFTLNATDPAPSIPASVQAIIYSNTQVEVNWVAGFFEKTYFIERSLSPSSGFVQIGSVNYPTTNFIDNGPLTIGTTYYYKVRSANGNTVPLLSGYSSTVSIQFKSPNFVVAPSAITDYQGFTVGSQWADFNNDSRIDYGTIVLNLNTEKVEVILFKNLGNGGFEKFTPALANKTYGFVSLAIADYNNDGFADISLGLEEASGIDIYEGNGDFTFDLVPSSQLGDLEDEVLAGISEARISWADINRDGLLDLFLWAGESKRLYEQNADHSFSLLPAGDLGADLERTSLALWADYDNDGFQDVLLTNADALEPVRLYRNNGNETFSLTAFSAFDASAGAWGDYNNDGFQDIYLSVQGENALYRNNGNGSFTKETNTTVSTLTEDPFFGGSFWGDFNNDGFLDLFLYGFGTPTRILLRNPIGAGIAFTVVTNEKINDLAVVHFGGAGSDFNEDGFLDIGLASGKFSETGDTFSAVNNNLYENNNTTGSWSLIKLKPGTANNKDVSGAKIRVVTGGGSYFREFSTISSLVSRNSNSAHFGLGSATAITNIRVTWPNGAIQTYNNPPINQVITINEDFQAPTFSTRLPANAAINVGTNTSIELTLNESSLAVAGKNLIVTEVGQSTPVATINVANAVQSGNKFTFTLGTSLGQLKQYNVTLQVGAFTDIYGNATAAITDGQWTFTTSAGPQITTLAPANSATSVNANTTLAVTFDVVPTAIAAKNLKLFKSTDLINPVQTLTATSGTLSGNSYTFTLPTKLERATTYQVSIDAGAFTDTNGNEFAGSAVNAWSFSTSAGPSVTTLAPTHNATNVNANTSLAITFGVTPTAVTGKSIFLFKSTDLINPVQTLDATSGVLSGNRYTFTLPTKLERQTIYQVAVQTGAFTDANGNEFAGSASSAWSFTTSAGPSVTTLTPLNGATGVSAASAFAIQFNTAVTAVAAKNVYLYLKSNLVTPVATFLATSGTISGNKVTFTPSSKLGRQLAYVASVDAGAFVDASLNDFAGLGTTVWEFTTDPGPVVSTFLPTNSATNIAVNAPIELTFDKAVTAVAGKNIRVMDGTTVVLSAAVSTTGTISGTKYSLPAPSGGWPFLKALSILVDAGAFIDGSQNDFVGLLAGQFSFTTVEAPDTEAPDFNFVPPSSFDKGFGTQTVSIEIIDNKAVTSAKLFHRGISGSTFTELTGVSKSNNRWEFVVPETAFDPNGLQYYLSATDAAGNTTRDPLTGFHKTSLKYTSEIEVTTALGFGGQKSNWKIFALPFEGTNSITSMFDEISGLTEKVDYGIITYNQTAKNWNEYPSFTAFVRGVGYFTNIKAARQVDLPPGLTAPSNTKDNLFKINLKAGWNMIGNPYLTQISWADVATYNSLSGQSAELQVYNGSTYSKLTTPLLPYTGGFVFAAADINNVSIPFLGQTTPGGRLKEVDFGQGDWLVPFTISQGNTENNFGGIGMHHEAISSFDDFDRVNAPRFIDFTEINFNHTEHIAKKFARDVVKVQAEHEWIFEVETNQIGMATLQWDASHVNSDLYLFDESLQLPVNMRDVSIYKFDPKSSSRFKVFYGADAKERMNPNHVQLGNAYPNPSSGQTFIPFSLPERKGTFEVQLDMFDQLGRKLATVVKGQFTSGFYQADWTPQEVEANGVYIYRLSVAADGNSEVLSGKILIKK